MVPLLELTSAALAETERIALRGRGRLAGELRKTERCSLGCQLQVVDRRLIRASADQLNISERRASSALYVAVKFFVAEVFFVAFSGAMVRADDSSHTDARRGDLMVV